MSNFPIVICLLFLALPSSSARNDGFLTFGDVWSCSGRICYPTERFLKSSLSIGDPCILAYRGHELAYCDSPSVYKLLFKENGMIQEALADKSDSKDYEFMLEARDNQLFKCNQKGSSVLYGHKYGNCHHVQCHSSNAHGAFSDEL